MSDEKNYVMTLDNNKKYAVTGMLTFHEKKYVYLVELEDYTQYIIGEMINDEIVVVEDQELISQLIIEFSKLS